MYLGMVMDIATNQTDYFVLVFLYQQIKRACIAFLGTLNELLICFTSAHSHTPPHSGSDRRAQLFFKPDTLGVNSKQHSVPWALVNHTNNIKNGTVT